VLAGVPAAWIVELPGANVFMFLSNEADILREVRAFAAPVDAAEKARLSGGRVRGRRFSCAVAL
jgi:hypothetical protein